MVDSVTNNRNIVQPLVGGDIGTWGGILNSGVAAQLDLVLGGTQAISMTSLDVTLSVPQWNNAAINLTGVLTGNHSLILPFNSNSATVAVGGLFVVANNTTGPFNVTVITQASASTGVAIPQGVRSFLYSDMTNVWFADDGRFQFIENSGNPNGAVAGIAGSVNNPPSMVWDYTNSVLYVCTTTGTLTTAVWTNIVAGSLPVPSPQGYLTPVSGTPIITGDSVAATILYYTPFVGPWAPVHNGINIIPIQFLQMPLSLSSSQAGGNIYDIFFAYNSGVPVIGTGPSWVAGSGGSITAGSCARGTGSGSTALARTNGFLVNANSMSLIYNTGSGNNTITVAASQGIYLGSIFMDATAGQITCHRTFGASRKWSIYNAFNTSQIVLQAGTSTASWTPTGSIAPENGDATISLTSFVGLPTSVSSALTQLATYQASPSPSSGTVTAGIGLNSTSAYSGKNGQGRMFYVSTNITNNDDIREQDISAEVELAPGSIGINVFTALNQFTGAGSPVLLGTSASMAFKGRWLG